jgi:KDO2-lipid IV(A) lauroyltransferase
VHFEKLTDTPKMLKFGTLTEDFTRRLETKIHEDSSLWLWSHKRWKREVPEGLESLRNAQEQRFNQKYR